MKINTKNISLFNESLRHEDPMTIVSFALEVAERPIASTSFGGFSAALLHVCCSALKDIDVIWCDTGYNTKATYAHANHLIKTLELNIDIFTPKYTTAYINSTIGIPEIEDFKHHTFSETVKLEPFARALKKHQPDVWFTNIRRSQTSWRDGLDILSLNEQGILKVSPFYYYSNSELKQYLDRNNLSSEFDYYDPVKAKNNRECGIHL